MPGIPGRRIDSNKIRKMLADKKIKRQAVADQIYITPAAIAVALRKGRMADYMIEGLAQILDVEPSALYAECTAAKPIAAGPRAMLSINTDLLRDALRRMGITQTELARRCGVGLSSMQKIVREGRISNWMLDLVCEATGLTREELIT